MYSAQWSLTTEVNFFQWEVDDGVDASFDFNYDYCWAEVAFPAAYDLRCSTPF
jgi:hypothetical protein